MEDFLRIGIIVKPQGVRGEVKVEPLTPDVARFKGIKEVYIEGSNSPIKVINTKIGSDAVFLSLFGISDRDNAELLRGKYILIKREDAISLKEDTFFVADIIGATLKTEDDVVGKIIDITSLKTDVFTVLTESGKIMRFPFLKDLLIKVDVENSVVVVKKQRLLEVSVYED